MITKINGHFTVDNFSLPSLAKFTLFEVYDESIMPVINRLKNMKVDEITFNDLNNIMTDINWELLGLSMVNNNLIVDYISSVDENSVAEFLYELPYVDVIPL